MDWQGMLKELIGAVAPAIAPLLVSLAAGVLVQIARRYGVEITSSQQAQIEAAAMRAVLAVEEESARKLKVGVVTPGPQREKAAINLTQKMLQPRNVLDRVFGIMPKPTSEQVQEAVKAALPRLGLGATGKVQPPRQ